jgi:tRNA(Arg) A34 adenosine deaminase TadA
VTDQPDRTAHLTETETALLRRAVELAVQGRATGEAPFGSLLAGPDGEILVESWNTVLGDKDISAHPELKLAVWAAANLDRGAAAGVTMYTSCQPCSMCGGAISRSGLGRVVYSISGEQMGQIAPGDAFPEVPQIGPALYTEGRAAVEGYYT